MLPDAALSGIMPAHMLRQSHRLIVLGLLACSIALLIPGLFAPVLTIRGVLTREGIAQVAPTMLERGLSDETVEVLKSMMNPSVVVLLEMTGGDLRKMILEKLGPQISAALQKNMAEVEVYEQTRSILGSVRRLYEVGSPVPATLILLFSVIVPFAKGGAGGVGAVYFECRHAPADAAIRGDDREMVDGGRLRRRPVHCLSRRAGERRANPGAECGAGAARVRRPLRRRFLLVRGLLLVLTGVTADHRAPGGGQSLIPYP